MRPTVVAADHSSAHKRFASFLSSPILLCSTALSVIVMGALYVATSYCLSHGQTQAARAVNPSILLTLGYLLGALAAIGLGFLAAELLSSPDNPVEVYLLFGRRAEPALRKCDALPSGRQFAGSFVLLQAVGISAAIIWNFFRM